MEQAHKHPHRTLPLEISFDDAIQSIAKSTGRSEFDIRRAIFKRYLSLPVHPGVSGGRWVMREDVERAIRNIGNAS